MRCTTQGVTTIVRCAALWLSGAALGVCAAFFSYQAAFFPDVYFLGFLIHNALLLVVALFAGAISLRPFLCSKAWTAPLLGVGHVTAAVGTHEFLRSRTTCFNIQQAVEYWLPTDSGPLLLFGPSLVALAVAAAWKRLRRPRPPASLGSQFLNDSADEPDCSSSGPGGAPAGRRLTALGHQKVP